MRPNLSKTDMGEAARQMICARLLLNEIKVFRPLTEDTPIDLLVLTNGGVVLRCQCKYIFPQPNGSHCMNLYAVRKWGPNAKATKHRYTSNEVDFFIGYSSTDDGIYIFPFDEVCSRQQLTLWLLRSPRGKCQHPGFDPGPWKGAFHLLR